MVLQLQIFRIVLADIAQGHVRTECLIQRILAVLHALAAQLELHDLIVLVLISTLDRNRSDIVRVALVVFTGQDLVAQQIGEVLHCHIPAGKFTADVFQLLDGSFHLVMLVDLPSC